MNAIKFPSGSLIVDLCPASPSRSMGPLLRPLASRSRSAVVRLGTEIATRASAGALRVLNDVEPARIRHSPHHLVLVRHYVCRTAKQAHVPLIRA